MSYKTVQVELENGRVWPSGSETLPAKARALLTLLESERSGASLTCGELAEQWTKLERLPADEAKAFASDIERSRASLPSLRSAWD